MKKTNDFAAWISASRDDLRAYEQKLKAEKTDRIQKLDAEILRIQTLLKAFSFNSTIREVKATTPTQKRGPYKKKSYKGMHWTQKPENKDRLLAMAVRSAQTRNAKKGISLG